MCGQIYVGKVSLPATVQTIPAPLLQIHAADGNAVLTRPVGPSTFILEQKDQLLGATWQDIPVTPVVVNGQNQVTLPMAGGQYFYRLKANKALE